MRRAYPQSRDNGPATVGIPFKEPLALLLAMDDGQRAFAMLLQMFQQFVHEGGNPWERLYYKIQELGGYPPITLAQLQFALSGQQVFVLGPVMQKMLEMTSLAQVDLAEVRVPYDCFYVAMPGTGLHVWNETSGLHTLEGTYVSKLRHSDGSTYLGFVVWGAPRPGRPYHDDAGLNFSLLCSGTLQDGVADVWDKIKVHVHEGYPEDQLKQVCDTVVRLTVGLCLYLMMPKAEVEQSEKPAMPRAARRRFEGTPSAKPMLSPQIVTVIAPTKERTTTPAELAELRNPVRRHMVRGHMHSYWVGGGDGKKKIIQWVEPYLRGAEGAEMIARRLYKTERPNISDEDKLSLARDSRTPGGLLETLAQDTNPQVRARVADNRSTPTDVLARMAQDSVRRVRQAVAENFNTRAEVLAHLARDSHSLVRAAVAYHWDTPVGTLVHLAQDSDANVRQEVASHDDTPVHILVRMVRDKESSVRESAVASLQKRGHAF